MSLVYNVAKALIASGTVLWGQTPIRALLLDGTYVPDPDHAHIPDVTDPTPRYIEDPDHPGAFIPDPTWVEVHECGGAGYTGGFAASGRRFLSDFAVEQVGDVIRMTAGSLSWPALQVGTVSGICLVWQLENDPASPLIAFLDGTVFPLETSGGDLNVSFGAGVLLL